MAQGYAATTIEHIATKAGLSVGSIYNLVGNKDTLYARTAYAVGEDLLAFLRQETRPLDNLEQALTKLIRYRMQHHAEHRLFLGLFSSDRSSGTLPPVEKLDESLPSLYRDYLQEVGFSLKRQEAAEFSSLNLALTFDGMISAFNSYLSTVDRGESLTDQVRFTVDVFLRLSQHDATTVTGEKLGAKDQALFISRFDYDRLQELIQVARVFGQADEHAYLDGLAKRLARARIVDPHVVPANVITMNARFTFIEERTGAHKTCTLVFPREAQQDATLSIISPLGAAVIGASPGDTVEVVLDDNIETFRIVDLLYQPESAGDYHL